MRVYKAYPNFPLASVECAKAKSTIINAINSIKGWGFIQIKSRVILWHALAQVEEESC